MGIERLFGGLGFSKPQESRDGKLRKANPYQTDKFGKEYSFTDLQTFMKHDWSYVCCKLDEWLEDRDSGEWDTSKGWNFSIPLKKLVKFQNWMKKRIQAN